jgi:hypothetical protein
MDRIDFMASLEECVTATEAYLREADKTSVMLGKCSQQPLSFDERLALMAQEILERDAFRIYLAAKRFLHRAALLGYDEMATDCSPSQPITRPSSQNRGRCRAMKPR